MNFALHAPSRAILLLGGLRGDNAADTGPAMKIALALGCDNSCYPPISWRRQQHSAAPTITKATIVVQTLDNAYALLHLSCAPVGESRLKDSA